MPSILCTKDFALTVSPSDPCGVPTFQINGYGPMLIAFDIAALMPNAAPSGLPEWDGILRLSGGIYTSNPSCYAIAGLNIAVEVITIGGSKETARGCDPSWSPLGGTCYDCIIGGGSYTHTFAPTDQIAISDGGLDPGVNLFNLQPGGFVLGFYATNTPDNCPGGWNVTGGVNGTSLYVSGASLFEIIAYP